MEKGVGTAEEAVPSTTRRASLAVGGSGPSDIPNPSITALPEAGATDLKTYSKVCGVDGWGFGPLPAVKRIGGTTSRCVGQPKEFQRQFFSGEVEVELGPQVTRAETMAPLRRSADPVSELAIQILARAVAHSVGD